MMTHLLFALDFGRLMRIVWVDVEGEVESTTDIHA
jgi:hypothetical protein